jgi:hypothetical protein|tara:strand:+ start:349 stop:477 length:129 start_codon:yes stop_codon:yes gene_type:complete
VYKTQKEKNKNMRNVITSEENLIQQQKDEIKELNHKLINLKA